LLRKLNYNAARGRKKGKQRCGADGGKGRERTGKTKLRKATNKRKSKAQEV